MNEAVLSFTYHKTQLNQWLTLLASPVAISNWLSAWLSKTVPFEDHLSTSRCTTGLRNKVVHPTFGSGV